MTVLPFSNNVKHVAIIGNGQLGQMLLESLSTRIPFHKGLANVKVHILDGSVGNGLGAGINGNCSVYQAPCSLSSITTEQLKEWLRAEGFLAKSHGGDGSIDSSKVFNAVVMETEHINVDAFREAFSESYSVSGIHCESEWEHRFWPPLRVLAIIQDKLTQKLHYRDCSVPIGPFFTAIDWLKEHDQNTRNAQDFIVKKRRLAYDGNGCFKVGQQDLEETSCTFDNDQVYVERMIDFEMEVSVIVLIPSLSDDKDFGFVFPVTRTVHGKERNVCEYTFTPPMSEVPMKEIERVAKLAALSYNSHGIFAVEMFVRKNGEVLVNEVAPRVHNSGHFTIEACQHSQFDMIWLASLGLLPEKSMLGWANVKMNYKYSIMINLLGPEAEFYESVTFEEKCRNAQALFFNEMNVGIRLHWYNKTPIRPGRKLGHITLTSNDHKNLMDIAGKIDPNCTICSQASSSDVAYDIGVVMGSESDWSIMREAKDFLLGMNGELFSDIETGVRLSVRIVSAHRTPEKIPIYVQEMEQAGAKVIIAGAGGAAHLPGMIAAHTLIPVIGVPILQESSKPKIRTTLPSGLDSILSILQMPKGVPVATVALNNAQNAMILALQIVALGEDTTARTLRAGLVSYRNYLKEAVRDSDDNIQLENDEFY